MSAKSESTKTDSDENKSFSDNNYLGELRPNFHCRMFTCITCFIVCLHPENGKYIYTLGPAEHCLFQDKKNF